MNEARSFLRYLLPGLVFIINTSVPLFITRWDSVLSLMKDFSGLVTLVGLLAVSGGLGYIFSIIYFSLRHIPRLRDHWEWNHEPAVIEMKRMGFIFEGKRKLDDFDCRSDGVNTEVSSMDVALTRGNCLIISNHYWCFLTGKDEFKAIDSYISKLCDNLHGLGATIVASFASLFIYGS